MLDSLSLDCNGDFFRDRERRCMDGFDLLFSSSTEEISNSNLSMQCLYCVKYVQVRVWAGSEPPSTVLYLV